MTFCVSHSESHKTPKFSLYVQRCQLKNFTSLSRSSRAFLEARAIFLALSVGSKNRKAFGAPRGHLARETSVCVVKKMRVLSGLRDFVESPRSKEVTHSLPSLSSQRRSFVAVYGAVFSLRLASLFTPRSPRSQDQNGSRPNAYKGDVRRARDGTTKRCTRVAMP